MGIEVAHSRDGIFISQHKYLFDLLKEMGMQGFKWASTSVDVNVKLGKDQ